MKIRGGLPFQPVQQTQESQSTSKAKGTQKKGATQKAEATSEIQKTEGLDRVEAIESPLYDVMADESKKLETGEVSLEEATEAVVSAVIYEHFGKKNLSETELHQITKTVSNTVDGDKDLRERLEDILRRVSAHQRKIKARSGG